MKKEEFINWIIENNIILKEYEIYPDKYTNVPFSSGCYTDKEGNWYYYHHIDERTSLIPTTSPVFSAPEFSGMETGTFFGAEGFSGAVSENPFSAFQQT